MTPKYSYISSVDFISNIDFEYVDIFSLQRGINYEEKENKKVGELERLEIRQEKNDDLSESEISKLQKMDKLHNFTQYLINSEGIFHPSAEKSGSYKKNSSIVKKLMLILNTSIKEVPSWMCAPIYRDAIVFYNSKNRIIATLNVCLSCEIMETKMFNHVDADLETYSLLREFFIELGHNVEDE